MTNPNKIKLEEDSNNGTSNSIAKRRAQRRKGRGNSETADWESIDPKLISELIGLVTSNKATITFGYTRDGGAYYLSYYFESESEKVYIRPTENVEDRLLDEIEGWRI